MDFKVWMESMEYKDYSTKTSKHLVKIQRESFHLDKSDFKFPKKNAIYLNLKN